MFCSDCRESSSSSAGSPYATVPHPPAPSPDEPGDFAAGAHPGLAHPYRPPSNLAFALRALFAAWMMLEAFALGALIVLYRMLDALASNPFAYLPGDIGDQFDLWDALFKVEVLFSITLMVFFVMWFFRAYGNLMALGARGANFGRGWAIGGWFVPFANAVIPWRIGREIWTSSEPNLPVGTHWRDHSADWRIHLWWATFVLGRVALAFLNVDEDGTGTYATVRQTTLWVMIGMLMLFASALAAVWFVSRASSRQAAVIAATGRPNNERDASAGLRWQIIGMVAMAAVLAGTSYLVFDLDDPNTDVGTAASVGRSAYEGFGISFEFDSDLIAVEQGDEAVGAVLLTSPDGKTAGMLAWFDVLMVFVPESHMVDSVIEEFGAVVGPDTTVRIGAELIITGPTDFTVKSFRIDGDVVASGAAGFGACADGRGVQVFRAVEGSGIYDPDGTDEANPHINEIRAMIESLEC